MAAYLLSVDTSLVRRVPIIPFDLYTHRFNISVPVGEPCVNALSFCDFLAVVISSRVIDRKSVV